MSVSIRFATDKDFEKVRAFDPHSNYIDPERIMRKIQGKEVILALDGDVVIGFIKFSYFWATRPFIDLIWIEESYRGKGVGRKLLVFLETYLVESGHSYLMSSSEKDEEVPQRWHRKNGFIDCGEVTALNLPISNVAEVFFNKELTK